MAETVVSLVVTKLSNPLLHEATFLHGVRTQVDWLRSELRWMEGFLKDAETKRRMGNGLVKNWVSDVRDVAYQAEDIIDAFMLQIEGQPRPWQMRLVSKILECIKRYACFPCELIARHKIGVEIEGLRSKIDDIDARRARFGLVNLSESTGEASSSAAEEALQARRRISPRLDDDTTVVMGFEAHKKKMLGQLLDDTIRQRSVVSIVGTGGLGKTTLATKIYNSSEVGSHFNTRACVSVSQDYRAKELLKKIIKEVMGIAKEELEREAEEEEDLKVKLRDFLKETRYFIVLDDIWSPDVWKHIERVLPDSRNGSRVLITIRFTEVASSAHPGVPPFQLPFLDKQGSWSLFLKYTFPASEDTERSCPKDLEDVAQQLVSRCGGLPLALVVLGRLLSRKDPSPIAWRSVADRLDWASTEDGEECLKILALSCNGLPNHYLKSCFLYIAVFPEDSEIFAYQLIPLWIAEGFIPESENRVMEETAQAFLDELAQRSMIQVIDEDWDGTVMSFKIHDLFRDLCLREAREDGFLNVYSSGYGRVRRDQNLRRLALHKLEALEDCCPPSNLRSLLAFDSRVTSNIFHGLKLLRVLCLREIESLERLPEEIKSMIHLRCLDLQGCSNLKELPSSIGNLRNLQTLLLIETGIKRLPKACGKIQTLRHLLLPEECACPSIGSLTNLQTLAVLSASGGWIESDLGKLCNIRFLILFGLDEDSQGKALFIDAELIRTLLHHIYLHKLFLIGRLSQRQLPDSHDFPPNLTQLELSVSGLEQDPMAALEKLPNLVILRLDEAYVGKEMACTARGFPQLQRLEIEILFELERWSVDAGAMPKLRRLSIEHCERLAMLPEGLEHVTSLRELLVADSREEFRDRLREDVGEDWHKIRHVRSIKVRQG